MSVAKITIEGTAQFAAPSVSCVCGFCGETGDENATVVFDFKQQKILFLCGNKKCKKMNEIDLGQPEPAPYPKLRIGR